MGSLIRINNIYIFILDKCSDSNLFSVKALKTIPFFRLVLPFVCGILISINFQVYVFNWTCLFLLVAAGLAVNFIPVFKHKLGFLIIADIFLFLYGSILVNLSNASFHRFFYGNVIYADSVHTALIVIDDIPVTKEKFTKCAVRILEVKTKRGYEKVEGSSLAYFKKSKKDSLLHAGALILVKTKFASLTPPQNPCAFNYKQYLNNKQVYHTLFVEPYAYTIVEGNSNALNTIWRFGLQCKQFLLSRLKNSALSPNSYAVCCALLTGYDDEIDKSTIEAFSHSGTLHVLSVSGLHTGLIYLVLSFLFDLFDKNKKYKRSRFFIVTGILWLFALTTGFSSPVLRAVTMFTLLGIGKIYFRNSAANQINILLVSAFILLSYNPFYIVDVGFLLSYFALAGLICFQSPIAILWQPRNFIINATWQSFTASFAATISTLPFTLLYFKQFPVWFFVCNIVVIPATFVILLLALLVIIKVGPAAYLINATMIFLNWFIDLFNVAGYGFIDRIDFTIIDALYLTLLILLITFALQQRSFELCRFAIVVLICWQATALFFSYQSKTQSLFTLYSIRNKTAITVKNKNTVSITPIDTSDYNYHLKPHIISFNNPNLTFNHKFNYLSTKNEQILILDHKGYFPKDSIAGITTLLLCNNVKLTSSDLNQFPAIKRVVMDVSNNRYNLQKTRELCEKHKIPLYSVVDSGAFLLPL